MANSIALAQKYISDRNNFNQVYKAKALTADLEANQLKVLDGNAVKLPFYAFSSTTLGNYNRATGAPAVDLVETWKTYTLSQDKGGSLYLDDMDDEETLSEGIIRRANEYVRQVVVPAVDTYRFSVLTRTPTTTVVGAHIVTEDATPTSEANILELIDAGFEYMAENEVSKEGLILYVSPKVRTYIQRSSDLSKYVAVQKMIGDVSTLVEKYNDAKIVEVPSTRLGAKVEFILVQPKSVASCVKFDESRLINATETTSNLFGFFWKHRLYYDLFIADGPAITEGASLLVNPGIYVHKAK